MNINIVKATKFCRKGLRISFLTKYALPNILFIYVLVMFFSCKRNPVNPFYALLDGFGPTAIFLGDSQTECVNNGNPQTYTYIDPVAFSAFPGANTYNHLYPQYCWTNIFATSYGKNLNVLDLGVGGSRMSWSGSSNSIAFNDEISSFNILGNVAPNWTGIASTMIGWNNNVGSISNETDLTSFYSVFETSTMAVIARLLIDNYAGVGFTGKDINSKTGVNAWATTGTNGFNNSQNNANQYFVPFRTNEASAARYFTRLEYGQYLQFTITGKKAVALFYETGGDVLLNKPTSGGTFDVLVNGVVKGSYSTQYTCPATPNDLFPGVVWLDNIPDTATIRINQTSPNVSGVTSVVRFLAYGWVESQGSLASKKMILVGSTSGNQFNHTADQINRMLQSAYSGAACFADYNVLFANVSKNWVNGTDQQPDDLSHVTQIGNAHIADAFSNNLIKPTFTPNAQFIKY